MKRMTFSNIINRLVCLALAVTSAPLVNAEEANTPPVKIYLLVGQSNMQGKGAVEGDKPNSLIREITQNDVARYFQRRVENNAAIDEVFLTDNQGANVAAFPPTSDYWQGDEEKWAASYNYGNGKVFIGPLEYDDSTRKTQVQISAPVISNDNTIGVLVLGVSVDYLEGRQ